MQRAYLRALSLLEGRRGAPACLSRWSDAEAWLEWPFKIDRPGSYDASAELSLQGENSRLRMGLPGQLQAVEVTSTGKARDYAEKSLGTIDLDKAGAYTLQIKP